MTVQITRDYIVKPDSFSIPEESTQIHGISHAHALAHGVPIATVLDQLQNDLECPGADTLIAHNAEFDTKVLKSEMCRAGHPCLEPFAAKPVLCTMAASVDFCKLPFKNRRYGSGSGPVTYKFPRQSELFELVVGRPMQNAHNSLDDVLNLHAIVQRLRVDHPELVPALRH